MKINENMAPVYNWVRECPRRLMVGLHAPDYDQAPEYARLIATGVTSLCDETGARPDFALAACLGVKRRGPWQAGYDRLNLRDRLLRPREPWVTPALTYTMGQADVRPVRGARVLGEIMSSRAVPEHPASLPAQPRS